MRFVSNINPKCYKQAEKLRFGFKSFVPAITIIKPYHNTKQLRKCLKVPKNPFFCFIQGTNDQSPTKCTLHPSEQLKLLSEFKKTLFGSYFVFIANKSQKMFFSLAI